MWHHELLAAMEAGVAVFGGAEHGGAARGGAGRARHGGRGADLRVVPDAELVDDSEVALLHADAEYGYQPLTVPLVNVRHVAAQARAARVLKPQQARALVTVAERLFYQERTWRRILEAVTPILARGHVRRLGGVVLSGRGGFKRWMPRPVSGAAAAFLSSRAPVQSAARRRPGHCPPRW